MDMPAFAFTIVDWAGLPGTVHAGETGQAVWRSFQFGAIRVRMVEYSPGYSADHWCSKGHVLYVLDGELQTELDDGRVMTMTAGCSYQVGDNSEAHRSSTKAGARLFIVD
jgi:quercetin dioxygenase-like cupin family protein